MQRERTWYGEAATSNVGYDTSYGKWHEDKNTRNRVEGTEAVQVPNITRKCLLGHNVGIDNRPSCRVGCSQDSEALSCS